MNKFIYFIGAAFVLALVGGILVSGNNPLFDKGGSTDDICQVEYASYLKSGGAIGTGGCCTAHSQCSLAKCECSRGGGDSNRCCHKTKGRTCSIDSQCQSGKCGDPNPNDPFFQLKCLNNPTTGSDNRPAGAPCDVNEDCKSGKCSLDQNTSKRKCYL